MKLGIFAVTGMVATLFFLTGCEVSIGESEEEIRDKFGDKFVIDEDEVYYKDGPTEQEAQALLEFLLETKIFNKDGETQSAQLLKEDDTYIVKIIKGPKMGDVDELDENTIQSINQIKSLIEQNVFPGESISFHITDDRFKTLREF